MEGAATEDGSAMKVSVRAKPKPEAKEIHVPLDEHCPFANCSVLIGHGGMGYDAALNQTNASHNNNKFYRIQASTLQLSMSLRHRLTRSQLLTEGGGTYRVWKVVALGKVVALRKWWC
ncbi:hypothetical protein B0H67DRAFT_135669 [Lasiosphaeris hirsuta]|uniref:WGR domain-containing protein n=1 Tax=Lasiosphaeris hirsuta TaxID=260670 RepID=A0AA40B125_9PEZI|nr:hypothetical protein B0H67DRAFT_135669 [Lasiosphaeris hirsuta]